MVEKRGADVCYSQDYFKAKKVYQSHNETYGISNKFKT
jgi:hypothetical protein